MTERADDQIDLPDEWWIHFRVQLKDEGLTLKEFCATAPVSQKTLDRAKKVRRMSVNTLTLLAREFKKSRDDLLRIWSGEPSYTSSKLTPKESGKLEQEFKALTQAGLFAAATTLATGALARAELSSNIRLTAHWADRVAASYRRIGELEQASQFYARASVHLQDALRQEPDDLELRVRAGKTRFGQIMVDSFLIRGAFSEALARHTQLLKDAEELLADDRFEKLARALQTSRTNIRRQQAEMLRLLGQYTKSLATAREVIAAYDDSAFEERAYGQLSEADSLRLLGDLEAALPIYRKLERFARDRDLRSLLGSVLWRQSLALEAAGDREAAKSSLAEALNLSEESGHRYRFLRIYCDLVGACGHVADRRAAHRLLDQAEKFGPLRPDFLRMEYAHMTLCRGELLRAQRAASEALRCFREALRYYRLMECRWGIVRSWIGCRLTDGNDVLELEDSFEGADASLLIRFRQEGAVELGLLSANLP